MKSGGRSARSGGDFRFLTMNLRIHPLCLRNWCASCGALVPLSEGAGAHLAFVKAAEASLGPRLRDDGQCP